MGIGCPHLAFDLEPLSYKMLKQTKGLSALYVLCVVMFWLAKLYCNNLGIRLLTTLKGPNIYAVTARAYLCCQPHVYKDGIHCSTLCSCLCSMPTFGN